MTKTVKNKGIVFPHEYLWRASSRSLTMAKTNDQEQYYLLMQSLLIAYLAFEAFINFLGECLDPNAWRDEKTFFNQKAYYGIEGKIKRLAEKLPNFVFKKGERPYQVIKKAGEFRTLLVHGKPYHFKKKVEMTNEGSEIDMFKFNWDEHISFGNVESSRNAIKEFCESLRSEAHTLSNTQAMSNTQDPILTDHLLFPAFDGVLASAEGETKSS